VRNRADGSVEALLAGAAPAVQAVVSASRLGPPLARVSSIEDSFAEPPSEPGFQRLPTL
jgi:acylphosphatase